jgi:hypothetical protein
MDLFTEDHLRQKLKEKIVGRTMTKAAREIGISLSMLSMLVGGYPMTGKAVAYLGFRKVRERLYRPIKVASKSERKRVKP